MRDIVFIILLSMLPVFCTAQLNSSATGGIDFGQSFIPDYVFKGSGLDGWHTFGEADWEAEEGVLTGEPESHGRGGWLVLDESYQDVGFRALFKCMDGCKTGVLFRKEETDDGMTGVYLSLNEDDVKPYKVTIDSKGQIIKKVRLDYAGGISYRIAPPKEKVNGGYQPPEGENSFPPRPEPEAEVPVDRPDTEYRVGEWNQIEIFLDVNMIRSFLNDGSEIGGRVGSAGGQRSGLNGYGPIAIHVAGQGLVHFADVMWKDISMRHTPEEKSSSRFNVHRINDMYYSWGADAADFNSDGVMDVVSGPYIYYGPDYTKRTEIYPAIAVGPSKEFSGTHIQHTHDYNHDGWPDILSSAFSTNLFINPGEASRRWESYNVLPDVRQGEITDFVDLDEDGTPELVYSGGGSVRFAKPHNDDPTKSWKEYIISEEGYGWAHGIGTGDINGDGRRDILNPYGWWEQPAEIKSEEKWVYHPVAFGRFGHRARGMGGSLMGVYDVNGNGMNDVVTSLNAHGFGLAWFEQKRDEKGNISFARHMISDDYSADNAGDVTFSQAHGNTFADVDGNGIQDFIVGKRYWTHLDNYYDPDPYGPPVLYWYKTVRDENAPGGARFEPKLIHNRSGAGSEVTAVDINKDGAMDIISATNRGTFIFWNTREQQ